MHRQHINNPNNDASQIFASIPIGSTVVVQREDGGPWTHGTIVGKGDHNHHNQSYNIQIKQLEGELHVTHNISG